MKWQLSAFFPAYNEESQINSTVIKAKSVLERIADKWEIIIIDDGSKDKTVDIVDRLAKNDKRIKLVSHKTNRGYGASLKTGFYTSKYPWIIFTDSDGQFDFSQITSFLSLQKRTGADAVIGYYLKREVPLTRKINTFLWQLVVNALFGLRVKDIDCGFKLISKKAIESIPKLESERGAFISSELLIKIKKGGFNIVEVGVSHFPRRTGKGTGANLNVIVKSFSDLFKLWGKLR